MSAKEPTQLEEAVEEEEFDLDALLASPEEQGDFECAVPEEFAEEEEEGLEARPLQPIKARCLREFTALRNQGRRQLSVIRWIVIHSTEGASARSSARWFTDRRAKGSAHLVVDDRECYRTLADEVIAQGAPGANTFGWHLELSGKARFTRQQWLEHRETLRRGAFKAAFHAKRFGIPLRLLSEADVRRGRKGLITHALCTSAFHTEGGHTDPGRNCPLDDFMEMANEFHEDL